MKIFEACRTKVSYSIIAFAVTAISLKRAFVSNETRLIVIRGLQQYIQKNAIWPSIYLIRERHPLYYTLPHFADSNFHLTELSTSRSSSCPMADCQISATRCPNATLHAAWSTVPRKASATAPITCACASATSWTWPRWTRRVSAVLFFHEL